MLGKLVKWLRVMGYDTRRRSFTSRKEIEHSLATGRKLLSRRVQTVTAYPEVLFIESDHVGDQLGEVREAGYLSLERSKWFSRCLLCNVPLQRAESAAARENIPEYVYYEKTGEIRFCPSCYRYFWPGSHRERMTRQLIDWGF